MGGRGDLVDVTALERVGRLVRPVALAHEQTLPVHPALGSVLPDGGLRRGGTVAVSSMSLALALVAEASQQGSWVATVGLSSMGLGVAAEMGLALDRLLLVAAPRGDASVWGSVVAALIDAVDVVLVDGSRLTAGSAIGRRVVARARERGAVLVEVKTAGAESLPSDLQLRVTSSRWYGLHEGAGHFQAREVEVEVTGRRGAARPKQISLWMPDSTGALSAAEIIDEVAEPTRSRSAPTVVRPLRDVG
ncbi:MAG: hypothetical protein AB7L13_11185 [Acidimicrobiia bacterium]